MIFTIGYEQASLADFVATLRLSSIETLVDIRERAQSRRKGFSKSALSEALSNAGIGYLHFRELGDPKEGRDAARRGDYVHFRKVFAKVMTSQEAQDALSKIELLASDSNICLMCYERNEKTCHRKIVSDNLDKRIGRKTVHLGVVDGAGSGASIRRVHDTHQSTAASV